MNALIRIPTTQYGYLEFEFEGTPEEAIEEHNRILKLYAGGEGLPHADWTLWLDIYLKSNTGNVDQYQKMSKEQQWMIQELKKAFKRIKAKSGETEIE